jgi:hypothetical protein
MLFGRCDLLRHQVFSMVLLEATRWLTGRGAFAPTNFNSFKYLRHEASLGRRLKLTKISKSSAFVPSGGTPLRRSVRNPAAAYLRNFFMQVGCSCAFAAIANGDGLDSTPAILERELGAPSCGHLQAFLDRRAIFPRALPGDEERACIIWRQRIIREPELDPAPA